MAAEVCGSLRVFLERPIPQMTDFYNGELLDRGPVVVKRLPMTSRRIAREVYSSRRTELHGGIAEMLFCGTNGFTYFIAYEIFHETLEQQHTVEIHECAHSQDVLRSYDASNFNIVGVIVKFYGFDCNGRLQDWAPPETVEWQQF